MTSVLGAAAAVMGGCILLQSARPGFDVAAGWRIWPLLAVAVLLAALGMVYQSRAQARRGKKSEQETEAAPPPPKSPSRR
jgi:CBS-domain-containing membrane protein